MDTYVYGSSSQACPDILSPCLHFTLPALSPIHTQADAHPHPHPTPPIGPPPAATGSNNTGAGGAPRLTLAPPALSQEWALGEGAFRPGVVGAKAHNLAKLRGSVPEWIHVSLLAACVMIFT